MSGFAVALYGLRSERNWGFGDFTDLQRLCKWAARKLGVSFIALNPLHAIPNRRPYNTSPYLPTSIFFKNYLYLDVEAIDEWKQSRRAQWCFRRPAAQSELEALRDAETVEYERVAAFKTRFLKLLFAEFLRRHWSKNTARAQEFRQFRESAGNLLTRFGLYCALNEYLHERDLNLWVWTDWPAEYRDPESAATKKFAAKHWRSILFHEWAAWQTDQQLAEAQRAAVDAGLSIGLYHDLALATDRFGADIWAHRDFFAHGCRVGSPPDDFSPQGQDWGFPPPNTLRHRADGYRMFRESIRRTAQHGGALRIDHVMRFFRLYWIPDGMDATKGAYVHDRAEDLVRILALESARSRILMVGEDLGTVEPYIREMLGRFGILSYRLFYFERNGDGSYRRADEYPRQALVSSSTHDLPTLAGFWTGSDIEARKAAGVLDEKAYDEQWSGRRRDKERMLEALLDAGLLPRGYTAKADFDDTLTHAILGFLASTPSMIMLVNQEDLTREPHQQNLPGTTSQYPNWGRKMRFTVEQLESDRQAREWTSQLCEQLLESGRAEATTGAARS
jgi:4-alpha-glucanotransferase